VAHNFRITAFLPDGDQTTLFAARQIHESGLAWVLNATLFERAWKHVPPMQALEKFIGWLASAPIPPAKSKSGALPSSVYAYLSWQARPPVVVDFDSLRSEIVSPGNLGQRQIVIDERLHVNERVWLALLNGVRYHLSAYDSSKVSKVFIKALDRQRLTRMRPFVVGEGSSSPVWTDGASYNAISREFLAACSLDYRGFCHVAGEILSLFCLGSDGLPLPSRYQAVAPRFIADIVGYCLGRLPQVLKRLGRNLTQAQLRTCDKAVLGRDGVAELLALFETAQAETDQAETDQPKAKPKSKSKSKPKTKPKS
jgi:hypothetical protein